jgi:hypothetical protein
MKKDPRRHQRQQDEYNFFNRCEQRTLPRKRIEIREQRIVRARTTLYSSVL